MNGRKAKALRRKVYGDGSKRNEYKYQGSIQTHNILGKFTKTLIGGLFCSGKRAEYLKLKKESKNA